MSMEYHVIGLMSGTSLDGVDLVSVVFNNEGSGWTFRITASECVPYTDAWKERLSQAENGSALELSLLDVELGIYFGELLKSFIAGNGLNPALIASHGHTIFHQPDKKLSLQIGKGQAIAQTCGVRTVADFRVQDVLLGGQGAPLVPVGDASLFADYDICLNIGGIANISYNEQGQRKAYDVCPANMVLNHYASLAGKPYDADGALASEGIVNTGLLDALNTLKYYREPAPKSLGKEWVLAEVFPLLESYPISTNDRLATMTEHIAVQLGRECNSKGNSMLVTGGGAYNSYLVERIGHYFKGDVMIPEASIIEYKEALIFAFLGVLKERNEVNCLRSVTGASRDHVSGVVFDPAN